MQTIISATIKWNYGIYEVWATVEGDDGKKSVKLLGERSDGVEAVNLERKSIGKEYEGEQ